jgi:hypothetical protein
MTSIYLVSNEGGTVAPFDQRRRSAFLRAELETKVSDRLNAPILEGSALMPDLHGPEI